MNVELLFKAIVDMAVFLSICPDDVVDQDAAVNQLEHLASTLELLDEPTKNEFISFCAGFAEKGRLSGDSSERVASIAELPSALGLVDDEDTV
jgi:hypothetical protein